MLLDNVNVIAIVCAQFGDTGKGKFGDYYAEWADIIARGTGGANAGHTICIGDKTYVFHLVPSGITHAGKINIIGNGVALDPRSLIEELDVLDAQGISYSNLRIALNAKLVLPHHILIDRMRESGDEKIGTTGRGIGPTYEDHYRRIGLTMNDLLNPQEFIGKFKRNFTAHFGPGFKPLLDKRDLVKEIMQQPIMGSGIFYDRTFLVNVGGIMNQYLQWGKRLASMIADTDTMIRDALEKGEHILLEGSQGNLLSVDFGTYPFVTSSDCTLHGLAKGVGLTVADVDLTLNVAKAYMTRVGDGPFVTEMGGSRSAEWCGSKTTNRTTEEEQFPNAVLNAETYSRSKCGDEFELGVAIRRAGNEYGATTGRARRVGWLDLPILRASCQIAGIHGKKVALTKIDVLSTLPTIKICTSYVYGGAEYQVGRHLYIDGDEVRTPVLDSTFLSSCHPVYQEFPGWMCDISQTKSREDLPKEVLAIIKFIEREADVRVAFLSVGPDRDQTIVM